METSLVLVCVRVSRQSVTLPGGTAHARGSVMPERCAALMDRTARVQSTAACRVALWLIAGRGWDCEAAGER